jgi:hypothetical protein
LRGKIKQRSSYGIRICFQVNKKNISRKRRRRRATPQAQPSPGPGK